MLPILVGIPPSARIRVQWTLSVMLHKDGSVTFLLERSRNETSLLAARARLLEIHTLVHLSL